ncbi:MAG TPA: glycosyltransferase family 9 protein [Candidatus Binatia bacterium]|jgi:ADP-heptose:LPS heptosyltransferase
MRLSIMRRIDYFVGVPATFVLTLLVRLANLFRAPRPAGTPRRVLFIELSEMGSTIVASTAIRRVQARYPDSPHAFAIFRKNAASLRLLSLFDERHIFTIRDDSLLHMASDILAFLRFCRAERIDTVIDLELFSRVSSILSLLAGATTRVGFHNYDGEGLYRGEHLTHRVHYNPYQHMSQNFVALIEALECDPEAIPLPKRVIPAQPPPLLVPADAEAFAYVKKELEACYPLTRAHRLVVVNHDAGSLLPIRTWPAERFAELARRLLADDPTVVVVLMGIAEGAESARAIAARVDDPRCINFVGRTRTLTDVLQLFHQATLLITNDSGPAHFASLTPIKSITLFGPETPVLYGPLGPNAVNLFANLACSPCLSALNHRSSPCTDNQCLKAIEVEEVLAHARRLLNGGSAASPGVARAADVDALPGRD